MYSVSKMSSLSDGESLKVTFDELKKLVVESNWAPSTFEGGKRKKSNFEKSQIIALDFDSGLLLNDAIEEFKEYKHIIGTSRNHQREKNGLITDRFRVILFLDQECIESVVYERTLKSLLEKYSEADQACKDSSRFYYPCTEIISSKDFGKKVTIKGALIKSNIKSQETTGDFLHNFISNGSIEGQRNNDLFRASCIARDRGKDNRWCIDNLLPIVVGEDFLEEEALRTIESAFDREASLGKFSRFILSSLLVVNVKDTKQAYLVNLESFIKSDVAQTRVKESLGTDLYAKYKRDGRVKYCEFEYNPKNKQIFLENNNYIDCFNSYNPADWFKEYFYSGSSLQAISSMPKIYEDFFKFFADFKNDLKSYEYLIDWLANIFQSRNKTILTLIGNQGIGKGVLGDIIKELVGESNFSKVRDTVLKNKFNKQISNKIVVSIDEIDIKNNTTAYDRLKDLVNDYIEIEGKGLDAKNATNYANFLISSNRTDCIRIEADNRRFSIIQLTDTPLRDVALIQNVTSGEYFKDSNIKELAQYLYGHKIKHDMLKPFVDSSRFNEIKNDSTHEWERWILDIWAVANIGKPRLKLSDFIRDCSSFISTNGRPPGQRKIMDLANRYPDKIKITQPFRSKGDASRYIEAISVEQVEDVQEVDNSI